VNGDRHHVCIRLWRTIGSTGQCQSCLDDISTGSYLSTHATFLRYFSDRFPNSQSQTLLDSDLISASVAAEIHTYCSVSFRSSQNFIVMPSHSAWIQSNIITESDKSRAVCLSITSEPPWCYRQPSTSLESTAPGRDGLRVLQQPALVLPGVS
jgi:hypothetical protein